MNRTFVLLALFISPGLTLAEEKKRPVTGEARPTLVGIDRLLEQFMADHRVPGAERRQTGRTRPHTLSA